MVKEAQNKVNIEKVEINKMQYFKGYDWEDNNEDFKEQREHKKRTNISELVYYLEEMYEMDLLDEVETDIYERYTYGVKITKEEWMYVYKNSYTYFFEKF